jgi:hypothetical protein
MSDVHIQCSRVAGFSSKHGRPVALRRLPCLSWRAAVLDSCQVGILQMKSRSLASFPPTPLELIDNNVEARLSVHQIDTFYRHSRSCDPGCGAASLSWNPLPLAHDLTRRWHPVSPSSLRYACDRTFSDCLCLPAALS